LGQSIVTCLTIGLIMASHAFALNRHKLEVLVKQIYRVGPPTHPLQIVRYFIPDNPHILEAGGHYGDDTIKMMNYWPNATIYSFEPNPSAYAQLKASTKSYNSVFTYPFALYNYDGMVQFRIRLDANEGGSSILPPSQDYSETGHTHDWWYVEKEIEVPCMTLDSWAKQESIQTVDFMWLDMEGVELQALKAGSDLLKNVKAIHSEVNFQEFRTGMTQYEALSKFLEEQGFEEVFFEGSRTFQGNAIFVRSNLID